MRALMEEEEKISQVTLPPREERRFEFPLLLIFVFFLCICLIFSFRVDHSRSLRDLAAAVEGKTAEELVRMKVFKEMPSVNEIMTTQSLPFPLFLLFFSRHFSFFQLMRTELSN